MQINCTMVTIKRCIVPVEGDASFRELVEDQLKRALPNEDGLRLKDGITASAQDLADYYTDTREAWHSLSNEEALAADYIFEVSKVEADEYLFH